MTLGLDGRALAGQWWQLWTCHLVHWDLHHLAVNLLAAVPPVAAAPPRLRHRLLPWSLCIAPLLSLAIIAADLGGEYRGASGLIVAAWAYVAMMLIRSGDRRIGTALMACLAAKLVYEALHGMPESPTFTTLPLAHYAGAVLGAATAAFDGFAQREPAWTRRSADMPPAPLRASSPTPSSSR